MWAIITSALTFLAALIAVLKGIIPAIRWYYTFKYPGLNPFDQENFLNRITFGDQQLKVIKAFLRAGMKPNFVSRSGMSPLIHAIDNGQLETVRLLLKKGADPNLRSGSQTSPLVASILSYEDDIKEILLDHGLEPQEAFGAYLILAAEAGDAAEADNWIEKGADLETRTLTGETALMVAAGAGHWSVVNLLIEKGAEVNAENLEKKTPLIVAAGSGHLRIVRELVLKRALVNASDGFGNNALTVAEESGFDNIVVFLRGHGAVGGKASERELAELVEREDYDLFIPYVRRRPNLDIQIEPGSTLLTRAVEKGISDFVKVMIRNGANPNLKGRDGRTALLAAVQHGHVEIVRLLLEAGADTSVRDKKSNTPLLLASRFGWKEITKDLVEYGARVNDAGMYGASALIVAAENGYTDIVEILLKAKASPDSQDALGRTPLMAAILEGFENIEAMLRNAGAEKGEEEANLILAAARGNSDEVLELIGEGANLNAQGKDGRSALLDASKQGYTPVVKALLEVKGRRQVNVNMKDLKGWTGLMLAADAGHREVAELLIQSGANLNSRRNDGSTALMDASSRGYADVVETLVASTDTNINASKRDGRSALHIAVEEGHYEIVELLVERGAEIDAATKKGVTPLMMAILERRVAIERFLRAKGAKKGGDEGQLFVAVQSRDTNKVQELIDRRINVNIAMRNGKTPLMLAAESSSLDIAEALVNGNANVDATDNNKATPLSRAAYKGRAEIVGFLCRNGASVNMRGREGKTPLILACEQNHPRTVGELVARGADVNAEDNKHCTPLMIALLGNFRRVKRRLGQDARAGRNEADLILAAESGNLRSVRNLVQNTDVHINACCKDRKTALLHACENGNKEIAREIVSAGADVHARSSKGGIALTVAARVNDTEIVNILLEGGALIDERGEDNKTALIVAAEEGNRDVVHRLLKLGSNPNSKDKDGNTALILAAGKGYLDVVNLLISSKASVNVKGSGGQTALINAAKNNQADVMRWLINAAKNNQADVKHRPIKAKAYVDTRDENGAPALIYAADLGYEEPAEILINENADVDAVDRFGNSPLMNATLGKHENIRQLLKKKGARTGEKSAQFIIAAAEGDLSELKALWSDKDLDKGVVDIQVSGGDTPLILALRNRHLKTAHCLIEFGADVDIIDKYGCTALIRAVKTGDEALVKAVTDTSRASVNAVYGRKTASTIAEEEGHEEILRLLVDHCEALKRDDSVYVTLRGNHYHVQTCHYWSTTCERKTLRKALKEKFSPCSFCVLRLHEHRPV